MQNLLGYERNIKELGRQLSVGESKSFICPFCNATHERSFRITRTQAGLLFICFRASCDQKGIIGDPMFGKQEKKPFESKRVTYALETLPLCVAYELTSRYGISVETFEEQGFKYCSILNALYIPIYNPWGALVGEQLKKFKQDDGPKVLSFRQLDEPLVHFPLNQLHGNTLVLVEDAISALKVS